MTPDPRADLAEPRPHGITRYKHGPDQHGTEGKGCRCPACSAAIYAYNHRRDRLVAYGRWEYPLDAAGTRRRLQALIWNGWSTGALAARCGSTPRAVRKMLTYGRVSGATAARVRGWYDELWDEPPPQGTRRERQAATRARRYARAHGWCPPAAWDDDQIDDPAAVPVPGWCLPPVAAAIREARTAAGLSQYQVAARVGVSRSAVQMYEDARRVPSDKVWVQLELTLGPLGVVRDAGPVPETGETADAA